MPTPHDLHIAIVGAGIGGLGCALSLAKKGFKHIDVYEAEAGLGFVGAGIQMAPNMARILDRLGCWDEILKDATVVQETSIRHGSTNEELTHVSMHHVREMYGFPHCAGHRASLAGGLYRACLAEPAVQFHFSTALVGIAGFASRPMLRLRTQRPRWARHGLFRRAMDESGRGRDGKDAAFCGMKTTTTTTTTTREFDVVLGADGISSATRRAMFGPLGLDLDLDTGDEADTGQAAYRITLAREQMQDDPELRQLVDSDEVVRWIGTQRQIIAYPVAGKTIYNIVSTQPDTHAAAAPSATYSTRGSRTELLALFADFCPLVRRLLRLVPETEGSVCEWRLRQHRALSTWVHGGVALLGDACHPTLPHLSQGAAMAVEDGVVLAEVLSRLDMHTAALSRDGADAAIAHRICRCLKTYEKLRKDRTTMLVDLAFQAGRALHLGEGAAKEERDRQFAAHRAGGQGTVPDKWVSPDVQQMLYSHDCEADAVARFDVMYAAVVC